MALMKLILRTDVDSLGRLGDLVTVKPGFGRNYLIPQGMAMPASSANLKQFELERKKLEADVQALRTSAQDLADRLAKAEIIIPVRVGDSDKLYGSVTAANIADVLLEQGIEIDRRKILLEDPIRSLGEYPVAVKLHADVRGEVTVQVVRHGQPGEEEAVQETGQAEAEAVEASDDVQPADESEQPAQ